MVKKLHYHFLTRWRFDAPTEKVWALIYDAETIARSWPGIKQFRILNIEDGLKAGCRIAATVKSLPGNLDFTMEVTEVEPGRRLGLVCRGDLEGDVSYALTDTGQRQGRLAYEKCNYVGPAPVTLPEYVARVIKDGAARARILAQKTIEEVKEKMGLKGGL